MASPRLDLRADAELLARVDRLAGAMTRPGVEVTRSGAARAALLQGLDVLEAEYGVTAKKGAAPAGKPAKKSPKK
jgi:predicted transcriptional regulator